MMLKDLVFARAWLWYHLAPAERNTLFSGRGSGDAFYNPAALAR